MLSLLVIAAWTLVFVRGAISLARYPRASPSTAPFPPTEAFVPARDEVSVIGPCVEGLLSQGLAAVTVIDDGSTDGTGAVLASFAERVRVLSGSGPGPGECGKPAALRSAVAAAAPSAEWLLFADADVVLAPGAVAGLHAIRGEADLVSVLPRVELGTAIEKIVMPAVGAVVVGRYPPSKVADPRSEVAFANGQVILVRRSLYERIGGHGAVIEEILEDVRLARIAKRAGGRLLIADGRDIARTRMYERWDEIVEGWSKNLFLLMDEKLSAAIGWALLSVGLGWAGPIALVVDRWPLGVAAYGVAVGAQVSLRALGGSSPLWALLAPIGAPITSWLLLRSAWLHVRKRPVPWKGRAYR